MARNDLIIENARIGFRNFAGEAGKFNNAGNRNFCVFIDNLEDVEKLREGGWNIKFLRPRDEGDIPQAYMQVKVRFENVPPKIILITSRGKTILDESSVNILDWAEIENVDLILNPYAWDVGGRTGVTAYLKSMYVTVVEDELDRKYADLPDAPDSAQSAIGDNYPI